MARKEHTLKKTANYMELAQSRVSGWHMDKIREIAKDRMIPVSRLVALAIDNEILKGEESFNFGIDLPTTEYLEQEYLEEAQKIMEFMKLYDKGVGLDILMLCRQKIGVPDKETFLYAFRELVHVDMIECFTPPKKRGVAAFENPPEYKYWRVKGAGRAAGLKQWQKDKRKKQYEKLKKEFENE